MAKMFGGMGVGVGDFPTRQFLGGRRMDTDSAMPPSQDNLKAVGQTANAAAATQGTTPEGPLGVVPTAVDGTAEVQARMGLQNAKQSGSNTGAGPGAAAAAPGLIAGTMAASRL